MQTKHRANLDSSWLAKEIEQEARERRHPFRRALIGLVILLAVGSGLVLAVTGQNNSNHKSVNTGVIEPSPSPSAASPTPTNNPSQPASQPLATPLIAPSSTPQTFQSLSGLTSKDAFLLNRVMSDCVNLSSTLSADLGSSSTTVDIGFAQGQLQAINSDDLAASNIGTAKYASGLGSRVYTFESDLQPTIANLASALFYLQAMNSEIGSGDLSSASISQQAGQKELEKAQGYISTSQIELKSLYSSG